VFGLRQEVAGAYEATAVSKMGNMLLAQGLGVACHQQGWIGHCNQQGETGKAEVHVDGSWL
jgi:hypothetical protein